MLDLTLNPSGTSCTSCNYPLTCRLKYHSCAKKVCSDPTKVFSTKDCTPNEVLGVSVDYQASNARCQAVPNDTVRACACNLLPG
jgi:hypothetical protein